MNLSYPELDLLKKLVKTHAITITSSTSEAINDDLVPVILIIQNKEFLIQIMDEYNDLKVNNPLLNVVLVLRELEMINDSTDFLDWVKQQGLNSNNHKLLDYYTSICKRYDTLASYFPGDQLTSFVSDLDFQLNAGPVQMLRNKR